MDPAYIGDGPLGDGLPSPLRTGTPICGERSLPGCAGPLGGLHEPGTQTSEESNAQLALLPQGLPGQSLQNWQS